MDFSERILLPSEIGKYSSFSPAASTTETLVVFIHGFRGKAVSTWLAFPSYLNNTQELRDADVLFYGYASRPQRMQNMAISLREDIDNIWQHPSSLGADPGSFLAKRDNGTTRWQRLLIVAHSLGAVVARRALLDCFLSLKEPGTHWASHCAMCLFAPAHAGANLLHLIGETWSTSGMPVAPVMKIFYPCLQDLQKDSQALDALRQDYLSLDPDLQKLCNATHVVLAGKDQVVEPIRFPGDPVPVQIRHRGHIAVCKPTNGFEKPVEHVVRVWSIDARFNGNSPTKRGPAA